MKKFLVTYLAPASVLAEWKKTVQDVELISGGLFALRGEGVWPASVS